MSDGADGHDGRPAPAARWRGRCRRHRRQHQGAGGGGGGGGLFGGGGGGGGGANTCFIADVGGGGGGGSSLGDTIVDGVNTGNGSLSITFDTPQAAASPAAVAVTLAPLHRLTFDHSWPNHRRARRRAELGLVGRDVQRRAANWPVGVSPGTNTATT